MATKKKKKDTGTTKVGRPPVLDDKQISEVISDYAKFGNYSQVGKIHNISRNTVRNMVEQFGKTIDDDDRPVDLIERHGNQVMLNLNQTSKDMQETVDYIVHLTLEDREKVIKSANLTARTTTLGIYVDKLLKYQEIAFKREELEYKRRALEIKEREANNSNGASITKSSIKELFEDGDA